MRKNQEKYHNYLREVHRFPAFVNICENSKYKRELKLWFSITHHFTAMSYVPNAKEIAKDIAALVDQSEHCGFCKHILHFFSYISTAFKQHRRYRGSTCGVVPNGRLYAIWELNNCATFLGFFSFCLN